MASMQVLGGSPSANAAASSSGAVDPIMAGFSAESLGTVAGRADSGSSENEFAGEFAAALAALEAQQAAAMAQSLADQALLDGQQTSDLALSESNGQNFPFDPSFQTAVLATFAAVTDAVQGQTASLESSSLIVSESAVDVVRSMVDAAGSPADGAQSVVDVVESVVNVAADLAVAVEDVRAGIKADATSSMPTKLVEISTADVSAQEASVVSETDLVPNDSAAQLSLLAESAEPVVFVDQGAEALISIESASFQKNQGDETAIMADQASPTPGVVLVSQGAAAPTVTSDTQNLKSAATQSMDRGVITVETAQVNTSAKSVGANATERDASVAVAGETMVKVGASAQSNSAHTSADDPSQHQSPRDAEPSGLVAPLSRNESMQHSAKETAMAGNLANDVGNVVMTTKANAEGVAAAGDAARQSAQRVDAAAGGTASQSTDSAARAESKLEAARASLGSGPLNVEVLKLTKQGGGRAVLEVTPPNQGPIRLDLQLDGAGRATLVVEGLTEAMRARLESSSHFLRQDMAQMGLALNLEMRERTDSNPACQGFNQGQFGQSGGRGERDSGGKSTASGTASGNVSLGRGSMTTDNGIHLVA